MNAISPDQAHSNKTRVGIIGGGVAGATAAVYLSQFPQLEVVLFEASDALVNGPPFCHLHAGGNLYRELDDAQCVTLLQESIATLKLYPHSANVRPTVIAVPQRDGGEPLALLPRLQLLQQTYQALVAHDPSNQVLGQPEDYFQLVSREQMQALIDKPQPKVPQSSQDWLIPLAQQLDFDTLKWPLVLVQEYGLSLFRTAASVMLHLAERDNCQLQLNQRVVELTRREQSWQIGYQHTEEGHHIQQLEVDYLINACGYRNGEIDDLLGINSQRMVEFKAAYLTHWPQTGRWPEVIFHGDRGTKQGMAQLTPYADGVFQLHGMTPDITLFEQGLVNSSADSAQPMLPTPLQTKLQQGWPQSAIAERTQLAIEHMAYFLPNFKQATMAGKPLFGAQQIPGVDPTLRASNVSFAAEHYARIEIVKANSALPAAQAIAEQLMAHGLLAAQAEPVGEFATQEYAEVEALAAQIAEDRAYPQGLARRVDVSA